jgi:hypothetical protein
VAAEGELDGEASVGVVYDGAEEVAELGESVTDGLLVYAEGEGGGALVSLVVEPGRQREEEACARGGPEGVEGRERLLGEVVDQVRGAVDEQVEQALVGDDQRIGRFEVLERERGAAERVRSSYPFDGGPERSSTRPERGAQARDGVWDGGDDEAQQLAAMRGECPGREASGELRAEGVVVDGDRGESRRRCPVGGVGGVGERRRVGRRFAEQEPEQPLVPASALSGGSGLLLGEPLGGGN